MSTEPEVAREIGGNSVIENFGRKIRHFALAVIFSIFSFGSVAADELSGVATVTDGDTIRMGQTRIRLFGIDAPESAQQCIREGKCYRCGDDATTALKSILDGNQVTCSPTGARTYGRIVATCEVNGDDISVSMVRQGWAVPYWRYLDEVPIVGASIILVYGQAVFLGYGIHSGEYVVPEDWRRNKVRLGCK